MALHQPAKNDSGFGDLYRAGVAQAAVEGLIRCLGAEKDQYGHLPAEGPLVLKFTNTRPLSPLMRSILSSLVETPKILELGAGAGVACSTISRLRPNARIESVALTPVNPYFRVLDDNIFEALDRGVSHATLFEELEAPLIAHQYIGPLDQAIHAVAGRFDLIFDCLGPVFYTFVDVSPSYGSIIAQGLVTALLERLTETGILVIEAPDRHGQVVQALRRSAAPDDQVTILSSTVCRAFPACALIRAGGPIEWREYTSAEIVPANTNALR